MWPETRKKVEFELGLLRRLVDLHASVIGKAAHETPDMIEVSALSAFLHSFYSGCENIFKRIATEIDRHCPASDRWHSELLEQMAAPNEHRSALLPRSLEEDLRGYLAFRHFFRSAYTFRMDYEQMRELVQGCEALLKEFEDACRTFFEGK